MRDHKSFLIWTTMMMMAAALASGCSGNEEPPAGDGGDALSDAGTGNDLTDGTDGTDLTDGTGTDGTDSTETDGTDGTDESDHTEPTDGTDSTDEGSDGTDSTDEGTDETDGTDGTEGTDGTDGTDTTDSVDPIVQCGIDNGCGAEDPQAMCYPAEGAGGFYPNYCFCDCAHPEESGGNDEDSCAATAVPWSGSPCDDIPCSDDACLDEWKEGKPVCALDGTESGTTYPNPYVACCEGYNWMLGQATPGACVGAKGCGEECPPVQDPVCGKWDHDGDPSTPEKTEQFANSCELAACGATLECNAPCASTTEHLQCAPQGCSPVCGTEGTTHRNACYLSLEAPDSSVAYAGDCCDCPLGTPADTVCTDQGLELPSKCVADCLGENTAYKGPCVTGCVASEDDPPSGVCGFLDGEWRTFQNVECAQLAGGTCAYEAPSDEACSTSAVPDPTPCKYTNQEYEPVCAQVGGGAPQSYANACQAGCEAATIIQTGLCDECLSPTFCAPESVIDNTPVCASAADCVIYPNSCIPEKCMGYEPTGLDKNECDASCSEEP